MKLKVVLFRKNTFNDSSIDILIYAFTKSTVWGEWLKSKEDIMYRIMSILQSNHLQFAFPTVTLDVDPHQKKAGE
jgi:MscS family membrane protein